MSDLPKLDLEQAHRYFSAECFNRTWDLIDKTGRTPEEDEQMLLLAMASFWHWSQRPDRSAGNLSVGYWLLARVHVLIGRPELAVLYGQHCLEQSRLPGTLPFHLAYACEALARAESAAGHARKAGEYLGQARRAAEGIKDDATRQQLLADLETIPTGKKES